MRGLKLPLRIIAARPSLAYYSHGRRVNNFPRRAVSLASGHRLPFFHAYDKPVYFAAHPSSPNLEPRAFVSTRKHRAPRLIKLDGSRRIAQVLISSSPASAQSTNLLRVAKFHVIARIRSSPLLFLSLFGTLHQVCVIILFHWYYFVYFSLLVCFSFFSFHYYYRRLLSLVIIKYLNIYLIVNACC